MMGSQESAEAMADFFNGKYSWDINATHYHDEHPNHRVRLTEPFHLGACHVTRGQFRQFVNDRNYKTDAEKDGEGGWATMRQPEKSKAAARSTTGKIRDSSKRRAPGDQCKLE